MEQLGQFILNHWALSAAFVVLLILIFLVEMRAQMNSAKGVSPQELVALMNHKQARVIDIRHADAFKGGHVIDALNLSQQEIEQKPKKLEKMKNNPIVIVCSNGQQSTSLATALKQQGLDSVVALKGGMAAWNTADLPLVEGK